MSRNADIAVGVSRRNGANYNTTFPISKPHPWRTKRADDPGFGKYYRDRYGAAESIPNGYFTSACSPLVYIDSALPGLSGQILACAPAQNFVHRAELQRDGIRLNIRRTAGEAQSEFIASGDIWFHPIHLSMGPNGGVYIADFYREIIEDYSAIPRYLQQQYGLDEGKDHGRVWRLVHNDMPKPQSPNMSKLSNDALTREVASPRFWRRQTARRLLLERAGHADDRPARITLPADGTAAAINALYTLDGAILSCSTPHYAWPATRRQSSGCSLPYRSANLTTPVRSRPSPAWPGGMVKRLGSTAPSSVRSATAPAKCSRSCYWTRRMRLTRRAG